MVPAQSGLADVPVHIPGHGPDAESELLHELGHGDEVAPGCGTVTGWAGPIAVGVGIGVAIAVPDMVAPGVAVGRVSNRCNT